MNVFLYTVDDSGFISERLFLTDLVSNSQVCFRTDKLMLTVRCGICWRHCILAATDGLQ